MGKMKGNEFIVKTIVTTELIKKVADKNHIKMLDCYTGFKWIAREIRLREGQEQYIGGGEESYGFLAEDFVRDKDAVSACSLLAEIYAGAKDQGKTLYDVLMEIYVEYGFSLEVTVNVVKPGKSGAEEIKAGSDMYFTEGEEKLYAGSPTNNKNSRYSTSEKKFFENNFSFLISGHKDELFGKFGGNFSFGGNLMERKSTGLDNAMGKLTAPDLF